MVAARHAGHDVVAILSAMGRSTDALSAMAYEMSPRPPLRELDALLSVGESVSCALASMAVADLGSHAVSLSGPQAGIRTDDNHGDARLNDIEPRRIREALADGSIVLVTGFQGMSDSGDVTTLGRGGSDASAVAVAAALGGRECEIFTDVAAVFTADPRIVPDARRLGFIRHEEMLEMAEAGAAVVQPRAVELAMIHGIDIHLRSSFSTEEGTWIRQAGGRSEAREAFDVAGIAHRRQEPLYGVRDVEVSRVAAALAVRGIAMGAAVPRTGGLLEFTAPGVGAPETTAALDAVEIAAKVNEDLGSIAVVGLGIGRRPDLIAHSLAALRGAGIAPRLVTTMPGRVSVLVDSNLLEEAVRVLHATFIPVAPDPQLMAGAAA